MVIEKEKIYKYIGLGFIGFVFLYLILRTLKFQLNIIEGMTTSTTPPVNTDIDNMPLAISNHTTAVEDSLLVSKYHKKYEDAIIALDKNIDYSILNTILKNAETISANPTSSDSLSTISTINTLKQFKDSLNEGMAFMNTLPSA
jgi:hypothetical protein